MTQTSRLHLPHFLAALAVLYVTGVGLALSGDLASLGTAIANGSKLNAPLPIIAAQLLGGFAALRCGGRARIAGALVADACRRLRLLLGLRGPLGLAGVLVDDLPGLRALALAHRVRHRLLP